MSSDSGSKFDHNLQRAAWVATIVTFCLGPIALIPAFGQWLDGRESSASIEVPIVMVASTPTDLPLISQAAPETPSPNPNAPLLEAQLGIEDPTVMVASTPTDLPLISQPAPETPSPNPNAPLLEARLGNEWIRSADEMVMVYVPPPDEPFELGSGVMAPPEAYWIDKHPVTNAQYQLCVDDGACSLSGRANDPDFNGADYPVVGVSWFDAMNYVIWLNEALPDDANWLYALPDEAAWEYAAVGDSGWHYPWGNVFDGTLLNFCDTNCTQRGKDDNWDDGYRYTSPVGSYPDGASWVGALDMAGNVWEWTDSRWLGFETWRVLCGGSWLDDQDPARAAYRYQKAPGYRNFNVGFRVVVHRHVHATPTPASIPIPTSIPSPSPTPLGMFPGLRQWIVLPG